MSAALDEMGIGYGERVAMDTPNSARLLTAFFGVSGAGPRPRADQLPARRRRGAVHRRSTPGARILFVDPELEDALAGVERRVQDDDRRGQRRADEVRRRARSRGRPTRTRRPRSTTRPARRPGRRACSSPTATSGSTRPCSAGTWASPTATCTCTRCPSSTATAGACSTPSPGWAASTSSSARSTAHEILRRVEEHGVTLMCGAPAVLNAVLDAAASGRARSPGAAACASSSPARPRRRARSSAPRPSSAGSSSRSTA